MPSVADTHPIALGPVELVAYKAKGTVWIGIRPQGSSVGEAIGLHTGSNKKHYLEATAAINGTWGVAFGAVSPEVERLEVRNERGESFPGRIIPLTGSFEEEYRTAWGVATVCKKEGRLIAGAPFRAQPHSGGPLTATPGDPPGIRSRARMPSSAEMGAVPDLATTQRTGRRCSARYQRVGQAGTKPAPRT